MTLSGRTKIAIAVAGIAGAAGLAAGGTALADPGGGRVELQIVSDEAPSGAGAAGLTGTGAGADGHDCPERDGGQGHGTGSPAADAR
ncbi:hypothetical protein SMC26_24525 [Actinomadura fulvescens]|uniref:Uncharacterized protein n=1 Tax=Actinomadura fulvescens TaxID=46160 RepID=A0ABN3Q231_9ACTN